MWYILQWFSIQRDETQACKATNWATATKKARPIIGPFVQSPGLRVKTSSLKGKRLA